MRLRPSLALILVTPSLLRRKIWSHLATRRCDRFGLALILLAAGCSRSAPAPLPEPASDATSATTAPAVEDVPRLALAPEDVSVIDRGARELPATAQLEDASAIYLSATTDETWEPELPRLKVVASTYGIATCDVDKNQLFVRFSGKDTPKAFDVTWEALRPNGTPAEKGVFHISVTKATSTKKTLRDDFFAALANQFRTVNENVPGVDSFYAFAAQRSMLTSRNGKVPEYMEATGIDEAMALYTGASSLHDALQSDRALRIKRPGKRTVPIGQITAAKVESHPWDKLLEELHASATTETLATVVPAGMLYIHASSAKGLSTTVETLTDRLVGLVQASGVDSGTGDIVERYATQIALEHSPAMAALADTSIDGIAIAASDPFFREGTDVTVAFHATNAVLLKAGLAKKSQDIATRFSATQSTYKIGTREVALTATADGKVNRHQLEIGDVILVSNSRAALERFIAVQEHKERSIAEGGDFTYLRTLYPYDRAKEDAFIFMGDAFVAHVTSPAFKIAAARRVQALAETQSLSYAAMLYAWLEGHAPESADVMLKAKVIDKSELTHQSGEAIVFDRYRGAYTSGSMAFAKPLIEHTVDKVTPEERNAYASFSAEYEGTWSKYIDPAALRIVASGKDLTLDARMLPIVNRGEYSDVESLAGPARIRAPAVRNGVAWAGAVGPEASLRRELEGTGQSFLGRDFQLGWLGDWVTAGASDRAGIYDVAIASGILGEPKRDEDEETRAFIPPLWRMVLQHAPLYIGAEVKNPVTFAALLTAARKMAEEAAPGLIEWTTEEPFEGQPVSVIREGATGAPDDQRIAIHYSTLNGAFIASLERATLIEQLTAIKEGRGPKAVAPERKPIPTMKPLSDSAQASIDYAPADNSWLARIVAALSARVGKTAAVRASFAEEAVKPYLQDITDGAQRNAITASLLGYSPRKGDVGATTNLMKVHHVGARLSVEGTGEHRGLHTSVTLSE